MKQKLDLTKISESFSYDQYRKFVKELLEEKKSTSVESSEDLYNYSVLNDKRMDRLDKTIKLNEQTIDKLKTLQENQTWVLITESWCGDAAQNLPIIAKMVKESDRVDFKIILRDKNLEIMDQFLTNGGRAIPKLIILDDENIVKNTWGARPSLATKMVADYKKEHGKVDAELKKNLQVWYNKNKGKNLQEDILNLI